MMNTSQEMDRPDGAKTTDFRSSTNIRPPSLNSQTPHQTSFSEIADDPSPSVFVRADSRSCNEAKAVFGPTGRTQFHASGSENKCLLVEKGIYVTGPKKQEGVYKKQDANQAPSQKKLESRVVKVATVEGVIVAVDKPELLSIPQTNFAIGLLVMCCFNPPFGLLALYFSLKAAAAYRDGNKDKGARCARTSIVISLLGIMLMMVVISSVVLYIAVNKHNAKSGEKRMNSGSLGF